MSCFDFVNVLTITNSAAVTARNPQCKKVTLDEVAHVGVTPDRVTPNIRMCRI